MKRVIVIGSGGAGKSTFAKRLGQIPQYRTKFYGAVIPWRGWHKSIVWLDLSGTSLLEKQPHDE